jgi:rhodanese-related sulfurtransferase
MARTWADRFDVCRRRTAILLEYEPSVLYCRQMIHAIGPQQARELMAAGQVDLVDVREPAEWSRGHLPGARLVPLDRLRANAKRLLPRDGIIFVCAAGVRSQTAARLAEALGLRDLYNLTGGTRAWTSAGLELVRDGDGSQSAAA